jgi:hypothetical protein
MSDQKPRTKLSGQVVSVRRGISGPVVTIETEESELDIAIDTGSAALLLAIEPYLKPFQSFRCEGIPSFESSKDT